MAEDKQQQTPAEANSVTNDSTKAAKNDTYDNVPPERFDKIIGQRNEALSEVDNLKGELEKLRANENTKREKSLKEQGEYKKLLDEKTSAYDTLNAKHGELQSKVDTESKARREKALSQLPEDQHKFTTGMDDLTLEEFVITKTTGNTLKTNSSRPGQGKTGEFGGYSSTAEWAQKDGPGFTKHLEETVEGYIK